MDKDTLELKNGTVIELESGASLGNMVVASQNRTAMITVWGEMTEKNLSEVQIRNGAGITVGRYADLILVSETSVVQADGTIHTSFCLREKDSLEKRMDAVERGQTAQDETIAGMGEELTNTQMALTEAYEMMGGAE